MYLNFNEILGCERNAQKQKSWGRTRTFAPLFARDNVRNTCYLLRVLFCNRFHRVLSVLSVLSPFFVSSRLSRFFIHKFGRPMVSFTMDTRLSYL